MALSSNLAILAKGHSNARSYLHQTKGNDWGEEVKQRNLTLTGVLHSGDSSPSPPPLRPTHIHFLLPLPLLKLTHTHVYASLPLSNQPTHTFMPLSSSLTQPHTL